MAIELRMPALSPTMEKGTLAKWLVAVGDIVKPGDLIAEIETDKATMEFESVDGGRISRLLIAEGTDDVAVGTVLALLSESDRAPGEAWPEAEPEFQKIEAAIVDYGNAAPVRRPAAPDAVRSQPAVDAPAVTRSLSSSVDRARVSPLALRIATARGVDLAEKKGTGINGRIVLADLGVNSLVETRAAPVPAATGTANARPPADVPVETAKLSSMRKTIARRLSESKRTVPHFYLTARCRLDPLLRLREQLNADIAARGIKLSVNDMLIKALALALCDVPEAHVQFGGDEVHRFARADISMAVAIEGGLVTPVIKGANALSLSAIAEMSRALAARARDGKLRPEEYEGGTASISNLGMFGIDEIFPVINPPQALILGVGAGIEQPWNIDGQLGLATVMASTASFDHRAIDGATGALLMQAFRDLIECPIRLLC